MKKLKQQAYRGCRDHLSIILTIITLCQRQPSERLVDYTDVQTTERGVAHISLIWACTCYRQVSQRLVLPDKTRDKQG
jgi:hypothetical protein